MRANEILKKYWNYEKFRLSQKEIIEKVLNNEDLLALLPTGGGKSICFQIPAFLKEGTTLVISPLVSLMRDQVLRLKEKGIAAEFISSEKQENEINLILEDALNEKLKLLYISPERLQNKKFIEYLKNIKVSFLAVDEAHCISGWGHDFRPSYLRISEIKRIFPFLPVLALSASATSEVAEDICRKLGFKKKQIIKTSFFRKNISYQVFYSQNKHVELLSFLKKYTGPSIIYLRNREKTKEISDFLNKNGFSSDYYHAGLLSSEKLEKEKNWKNELKPIIVATNAFGMGIDKANVRFVCHFDQPDSIENYFQEVGRAGRDGKNAFGILLYGNSKDFIPSSLSKYSYEGIYKSIFDYHKIPLNENLSHLAYFDLELFLKKYNYSKNEVLKVLEHLEVSQKIKLNKEKFQTFQVLQTKKVKNNLGNYLIDYLIRKNHKIIYREVEINFHQLLQKINCSYEELKNIIIELIAQKNIQLRKYNYKIFFLCTRKEEDLKKLWISYERNQKQKAKRFNEFIFYIENKKNCRSKILLHYFGETRKENCGICDFCLKSLAPKINFELINPFIKEKPREFSEVLIEFNNYEREKIKKIILEKLESGKLKFNDKNQLT